MPDFRDEIISRALTFLHPAGSNRSPRKVFGQPVEGVYPQITSSPNFLRWTRTVYAAVPSLRAAFEIFRSESERSSAFIHGAVRDTAPEVMYRRRDPRHGEKVTIDDTPSTFLMLDIDGAPPLEGVDLRKMTPEEVWSYLRLGLPEEIRVADCILQLSQSFATKPGQIKAHVVVELSRPLTWRQRDKLLALSSYIDRRVNQPEQMSFIVAPVFEGCADPLDGTPLAGRWFYIKGETPLVAVPTDEALDDRADEAKRRKEAERATKNGERVVGAVTAGGRSFRAGLDYWIKRIGADGHFEGPRLAAVRAFVAAEGENGDLNAFLVAVREHLVAIGADRLQHAGYVDSVIADMPRLVGAWAARLRDRDLPQPCEWTGPQTVTLDEATVALDRFAEETTAEAIGLFERRVEGLAVRRAVEDLVNAKRHVEALALARAAGVYELQPDWREEDVTPQDGWYAAAYDEPQVAPCALNVTQGAGKTAAGVRMGAAAARAGLRVAMLVATHSLARELVGRFAAEGATAAVWLGETAIGPDGEAACPRHAERTELRRAGIAADMLCGNKVRGFCPLMRKCRYLRQRPEIEAADVVLFCGGSTLAAKPPAPFRGADIERAVHGFDIEIRREPKRPEKGADYLPPIDLLLVDEPVWTQIIEQAEKADAAEGPGVVTLVELTALAEKLDKEGDEVLLPFVRVLAARVSGARGYWSHGDIAGAVEHIDAILPHDRLKIAMRAATGALEKARVDPGADVLSGFAKTPEAARNRLLMQAFRIARAMLGAVKASSGAAGERETPYLVTVATSKGPAVHVRRVGAIHRHWRRAQIVVLDATYRGEIAQRFLPELQPPVQIAVAVPDRAMVVRQVFDSQVGVGKLNEMLDQWRTAVRMGKPLPRGLRDLMAFVEIAAARVHGRGDDEIDFLVVTIKPLADFLIEQMGDRKPAGLAVWHFNNSRGLDEARGAAGIALIGRPLPAPEAAADLAALLTGSVEPVPEYQMAAGVYQSAKDRRRGFAAEGARSVLPDPFMQVVADSVCRDALSHAIARVRPVRRPGAQVQAWVLTSEPAPNCPVDDFLRLDEVLAPARNPFLLGAARGVAVAPNTKGGAAVLAAVTGMTAADLRNWRQREGESFMRDAQLHQKLVISLPIGIDAVENGGRNRLNSSSTAADDQVPRAILDPALDALREVLSCGRWMQVRLALTGARYAVPAAMRAQTLDEARALWSRVTGRDGAEVQPEGGSGGKRLIVEREAA